MSTHRWLAAALVAAGLTLTGGVSAEPAKIAGSSGAQGAFGKFATSWMADMEKREASNRRSPAIQRYAGRTYATYVGYSQEWNTEVHATGDSSAPYVGVLHYKEQTYTCSDETTRSCSVASTTPVTEVFPYRDGRWKY